MKAKHFNVKKKTAKFLHSPLLEFFLDRIEQFEQFQENGKLNESNIENKLLAALLLLGIVKKTIDFVISVYQFGIHKCFFKVF